MKWSIWSAPPISPQPSFGKTVFGSSGSGKTTCNVENNIEAGTASLVAADPKGTLCEKKRKPLEDLGFRVYSLDFINPEKNMCRRFQKVKQYITRVVRLFFKKPNLPRF